MVLALGPERLWIGGYGRGFHGGPDSIPQLRLSYAAIQRTSVTEEQVSTFLDLRTWWWRATSFATRNRRERKLNVRAKVARHWRWRRVPELVEEIHEANPSVRRDWPCAWWGLEPLNTKRADWQMQYAAVFRLNEGG